MRWVFVCCCLNARLRQTKTTNFGRESLRSRASVAIMSSHNNSGTRGRRRLKSKSVQVQHRLDMNGSQFYALAWCWSAVVECCGWPDCEVVQKKIRHQALETLLLNHAGLLGCDWHEVWMFVCAYVCVCAFVDLGCRRWFLAGYCLLACSQLGTLKERP